MKRCPASAETTPTASLVAVISLAALTLLGCEDPDRVELVDVALSPSGTVSSCEWIDLGFTVNQRARYSVASGASVIAAGITSGLREHVGFSSSRLDPDASQLRVVVAAANETVAVESLPLALDTASAAPIARPRLGGGPAPGEVIRLRGSASEDPDGGELEYSWSIVTVGSAAQLDEADQPDALLLLPEAPATVEIALTVTDDDGATGEGRLIVRAEGALENSPPRFDQPEPPSVLSAATSDLVVMDVAVSDPDGDDLRLDWTQISGPPVALDITADGLSASFTAPSTAALLAFDVAASDGIDETRTRIQVSVGNLTADTPPIPAASLLDQAALFHHVRLSAAGTVDPDSEDLSFEWRVESAPVGSLVADDALPRRRGAAATETEVFFDIPGDYVFSLRAADGLGVSPHVDRLSASVRAETRLIAEGAITDLDCGGANVMWADAQTSSFRLGHNGVIERSRDGQVMAVHIDADGLRWQAFESGGSVVIAAEGAASPSGIKPLPPGATVIYDLVTDPAPSRRGDVYVGTDAGTAILDLDDDSCGDVIGCWVGSPSTGYLHRPPSLAGQTAVEAEVLHATLEDDGATAVYIGNHAWMARLVRSGADHDFLQAVIDLFDDRLPQRIAAIETLDGVLYAGADGLGVVRAASDGDCAFGPLAPRTCGRQWLDECTLAPTAEPPLHVIGLAGWNDLLFVATNDGFLWHAPERGAFGPLSLGEDVGQGTPTGIAVCNSVLYLATDQGLWEVILEGELG